MSVSKDELAGAIAQIRHTPQLFQLLLMGISTDDLGWKPSPSRFSISEILAHLAHVDEHCFGLRLNRVMEEDSPHLDEYDDAAFLTQPPDFLENGPARLDGFTATRTHWMKRIEGVTVEHADRVGHHSKLGAITVAELIHEWAFHDLGHVRQVAELLRARRYYPHIGPFQPLYTVRP